MKGTQRSLSPRPIPLARPPSILRGIYIALENTSDQMIIYERMYSN